MTIVDTKNMDDQTAQRLRRAFKMFNHCMLIIWRLGLGKYVNAWPKVGGRTMILVHDGRTSGKPRQTPLNYTIINGEIYCLSGFGPASDWFQNILANPQVEIWLPDGWWAGLAEEYIDPERRLPLIREIVRASGAAGPAFGVDGDQLNDEELAKITKDYRLVRIKRTAARTGPGGPGDLAWVWPLSTFILLFMGMFRPRRRRR